MSLVEELKQLTPRHYYLVVLIAMATILPGYLSLFLFKRELFLTLDTFKLLLLGTAISLPVFFANFILFSFSYFHAAAKNGSGFAEVAVASLFTILAFHGALLAAYLTAGTFRGFLSILAWAEVVALLVLILGGYAVGKRTRARSPSQGRRRRNRGWQGGALLVFVSHTNRLGPIISAPEGGPKRWPNPA